MDLLFPHDLKVAAITPILKKPGPDNTVLNDFRPILNLPFVTKIFEVWTGATKGGGLESASGGGGLATCASGWACHINARLACHINQSGLVSHEWWHRSPVNGDVSEPRTVA